MLSSTRLTSLLLSLLLTFTLANAQAPTSPPGPASVSSNPTTPPVIAPTIPPSSIGSALSSKGSSISSAGSVVISRISSINSAGSSISSQVSSLGSQVSSVQSGVSSGVSKPPPSITDSGGASMTNPDVLLNVPTVSVGRIELDVDNLQANINLNAQVANLVTINAGVAVGITTVNLTIVDIDAQLELIVRLGHLVDIVNRVFHSLDLNPLLIDALNTVTGIVTEVVGAVDGLLGSITQGGTTLSFIIDNLGNIVQEVAGLGSTIVGNYAQNMTYTGQQQTLSNGNIQKTYSYAPLNALVNIIFNSAGQIVQATVAKQGGNTSLGGSSVTGTATKASTLPSSTG